MLRSSQQRYGAQTRLWQGTTPRRTAVKLHVDYETAKRLGQEFSAPCSRGLYLVSLTRTEYDELKDRQ